MPDPLRAATLLSASLAATGAWRGSRVAKWQAYWPVPLMAFALVLAARDLVLMLGPREADLPFSSLALGTWAGVLVTLAGAIEVRVCRRGGPDGRRLIAASLLVAAGSTLLLYQTDAAGVASGLLILVSGVLLAMVRSMVRPGPALHLLWPVALLGGALAYRSPALPDALAEARREMDIVLTQLRLAGARVVPVKAEANAPPFARGPVRSFRIDGNEVQVYLIAHNDDAAIEAHLSPRVSAPPTIAGVPHLHVGPHILVLCVTADPRFARQLDSIVRRLAGPRRQRSFPLVVRALRELTPTGDSAHAFPSNASAPPPHGCRPHGSCRGSLQLQTRFAFRHGCRGHGGRGRVRYHVAPHAERRYRHVPDEPNGERG